MTTPQGLAFSSDTFAKLAPAQFLQAHLSDQVSKRPNGRARDAFREPVVNTGSLAHSNGSAVVRLGDTAVVCGVRAEILLASDIPRPPKDNLDLVERLGLLVPNLELSTGCSHAHLPGNPPSNLAQALSWRLNTLLHSNRLISIDDLAINYTAPPVDDDEATDVMAKAYWTLYIDILCISLDGSCLDAAWIAILAALRDTRLPKARWDQDRESILCSPLASLASPLRVQDLPVCSTFAVFSTSSPLKQNNQARQWTLADPDTFEEDACRESITITIRGGNDIVRIERSGTPSLNFQDMKQCVKLATGRWQQISRLLSAG